MLDLIKRLFAAVESKKLSDYLALFTEDAVYKSGNSKPSTGMESIRESMARVLPTFKSVSHHILHLWEVGDRTVVCELEIVYTRNDNKVVTLPCLTIVRIEDGRIHEYQEFIDTSPVFS